MERGRKLDRLSSLPCEILDRILYKLPTKEAVRTCVLSSKWRFKFSSLKDLVFDEQYDTTLEQSAFANIVDRVLLLHIGPIDKFKLSHKGFKATRHIDRWILHLSRCSIKEFILEIWKGGNYSVPSCLFFFQDITHLELYNCLLSPPLTFKGFRSLKTIDFQEVPLAPDVFASLIACCPLLESLTYYFDDAITCLKINAPNLEFLDIEGVFEEIILENTSKLACVNIGLIDYDDQGLARGCSSNLVKFLNHLPRVQHLEIWWHFREYLAVGDLPRKLPKPCLYLKFLCISICLNCREEVSTALCLLRSSPALQELELVVCPDDRVVVEDVNSLFNDSQSCQFTNLRLVKITGFSGIKSELDFIRYLLLCSPVLESMTITPISVDGSTELLKKLLRFKRASVDAEINYLDP